MKRLTIFTPTYNRAYILPELYRSLKAQTNNDFIWLIVDDGSTDGTGELVKSWIAENVIDIKYYYQENGGKMKAHNFGVQMTETEMFVCVDSDDWIACDSVEKIVAEFDKSDVGKKNELCGIVAYRGKKLNEVIGTEFPANISYDTLSGLYKKGFKGDTVLIFKTDIIRQYPFPIIENEKFITEAYVYDQIDRKYKWHLFPSIITICQYNTDGLTLNLLKYNFKNPCGYVSYFIQKGNFSTSIIETAKAYIRANAFRHMTRGVVLPVMVKYSVIYKITRPFGWILYLRKKFLYRKTRIKV